MSTGDDEQHDDEHGRVIGVHGARFAVAMVAGHAGDPDEYRGWTGLLQMAVDFSRQDPELLTVADEVHVRAGTLRDPDVLRGFAESRRRLVAGHSARCFLAGVLDGLWAARRHASAEAADGG